MGGARSVFVCDGDYQSWTFAINLSDTCHWSNTQKQTAAERRHHGLSLSHCFLLIAAQSNCCQPCRDFYQMNTMRASNPPGWQKVRPGSKCYQRHKTNKAGIMWDHATQFNSVRALAFSLLLASHQDYTFNCVFLVISQKAHGPCTIRNSLDMVLIAHFCSKI